MPELIHLSDLTRAVNGIYRKNFKTFFKVLLWMLIPVVLSASLPVIRLSPDLKNGLYIILNGLTALVSLWLSVVLVDMTAEFLGKKTKPGRRSWGIWGRIIDLVLISILQGLIVFIGFLLFIVPGIIFAVWFSFARYAVLVDAVSPGSKALRHSKNLVRGKFWKILGRWAGAYIYYGIFLFFLTALILTAVGALLGNPGTAFAADQSVWWAELIISVIAVFAAPIFVGVGVTVYESAKAIAAGVKYET